jgi:uncharacterized protein
MMLTVRYLVRFAAAALLLAAFASEQARAQSFNCRLARTPDEVLICQDATLMRLDERMSSVYFALRNRLAGARRARLEAGQAAWLRQRMDCGRQVSCIEQLYRERIRELRGD